MSFTKGELSTLCRLILEVDSDNDEIVRMLNKVNCALSTECDLSQHYSWLMDNLLNAFKITVSKHLKNEVLREIDAIVEHGPAPATFLVLVAKIQCSDDAIQLNHCVELLEVFLKKNRFCDILWCECVSGEKRLALHNDLVVTIASVPERLANKLGHENRDAFLPVNFISQLSLNIISTCRRVSEDLRSGEDRNVQFLGLVLNKLCQCGYGKQLWKEIFNRIGSQFETDFVLSRVFEKILSHVPGNSCECVLVPMLTECPCHGIIGRLLGDSVLLDTRIKFLLTNKLILHRYFNDTKILLNICGYLSKFPNILKDMLKSVLQVWSSAGYVKRTSYEQQKYVSSAVVLGLAFLTEDLGEFSSFLNEKCLLGVPYYLDSGVERIRLLGMVLAEIVTKRVTPVGDGLQFEYADSNDTRALKSLLSLPKEFCELNDETEDLNESHTVMEKPRVNATEETTKTQAAVQVDDLDSDDDLVPYDLGDDKPKLFVKEPKYIRQCMDGFLVKEDADTFEISLQNAAKIVRKNRAQAKELAEEFAMIVIRTEDQYDTENFAEYLRDLLVALICASPKQVAKKLCEEFYARNYNIKQRLDILDALAQSAQCLAKLDKADQESLEMSSNVFQYYKGEISQTRPDVGDEENWRTIVDRRIQAKTRRFASSTREIAETENKFGPLAGYFFFPLLYPSTVDPAIDIRGRDSVLLVRLLYTLSIVLHSSVNTPVVIRMAIALMEFVWLFRVHSEAAVRRGTIFAVNMVYRSVPPFVLLREMEEHISESKFWLEHVLQEDQDNVCRELAKHGLLLLVDALKKSNENE